MLNIHSSIITTKNYLFYERYVGWDMIFLSMQQGKKYEELKREGEGRTCGGGSDKGYVGSRTLQKHNTFYVSSCAIIAVLQTT